MRSRRPEKTPRFAALIALAGIGLFSACAESATPGGPKPASPIKVRAGDERSGAFFGGTLDATATDLIVGARGHSEAGSRAGAAYLFEREGARWRQAARLSSSDLSAEDHFGYDVAISGPFALVGAPHKSFSPEEASSRTGLGAAYLFHRAGDTWQQIDKWRPASAEDGSGFGSRVAIDGDRAVVSFAKDRRNIVQPTSAALRKRRGKGPRSSSKEPTTAGARPIASCPNEYTMT